MSLINKEDGGLRGWVKAGILAATITAPIGAFFSSSTVNEGELGVLTNFGAVTAVVEPGLVFHWPWQDVKEMSVQSQTVDIKLEVYSKDSQLAPENVLSVTFSLPSENVREIYSKYGVDYFNTVLKNPIENIFRECFGKMTADHIIADREALNTDISNRLMQEFDSRSLKFERISISIKFNDAYNHAAEESAIARIKVNTEQQNLESKEIVAKQTVIEAQAQADSNLAKKNAEAKGIEAVGTAEAKVIVLKAKAVAANPAYPQIIAAEAWDGKLPQVMPPAGTLPFIELSSPASFQRPVMPGAGAAPAAAPTEVTPL